MARIILSQTLSRSPLNLSHRILTQRHRSNDSGGKAQLIEVDLQSDGDVEVLGIRKLEDVIHSIIAKRSAPDWLPFIPGSSYWVPPRPRPIVPVQNLTNALSDDEALSLSTVGGWPSSAHFIQGSSPTQPVPLEMEVKVHNDSESAFRSADEEE